MQYISYLVDRGLLSQYEDQDAESYLVVWVQASDRKRAFVTHRYFDSVPALYAGTTNHRIAIGYNPSKAINNALYEGFGIHINGGNIVQGKKKSSWW